MSVSKQITPELKACNGNGHCLPDGPYASLLPTSYKNGQTDALESNPERYGVFKRIQSTGEHRERVYADVKDLGKMEGHRVWVRARLQTSSSTEQGWSALLRHGCVTVRFALSGRVSQGMLEFAANITKESIVDVYALVARASVEGCSEVELQGEELWMVSPAKELPFPIEATPGTENHIDLDTRLDYRVLDLRSSVNHAIFRVEVGVCRLFRESLTSKGFLEIFTPRIIQGIFSTNDEEFHIPSLSGPAPCTLANTIHFHKQLAIMADFEKVFSIGTVFRREKSSDERHLIEFRRIDFLMTFKQHYHEVLDVIGQTFIEVFRGLQDQYASEIATVGQQYKVEPFKFSDPPLRLEYQQAVQMLKEVGVTPKGGLDELSPSNERVLGKLVRDKYDTDFFIVDKFPAEFRCFFSEKDPRNREAINGYDMYMRGMEMLTGSQAIYVYDTLVERAKQRGIGAAIGLERVVTQFLGLGDIRKAAMFPRDLKRLAP